MEKEIILLLKAEEIKKSRVTKARDF